MQQWPKFKLFGYYFYCDWLVWRKYQRIMTFYVYDPINLDEFIIVGPVRIRKIHLFEVDFRANVYRKIK